MRVRRDVHRAGRRRRAPPRERPSDLEHPGRLARRPALEPGRVLAHARRGGGAVNTGSRDEQQMLRDIGRAARALERIADAVEPQRAQDPEAADPIAEAESGRSPWPQPEPDAASLPRWELRGFVTVLAATDAEAAERGRALEDVVASMDVGLTLELDDGPPDFVEEPRP